MKKSPRRKFRPRERKGDCAERTLRTEEHRDITYQIKMVDAWPNAIIVSPTSISEINSIKTEEIYCMECMQLILRDPNEKGVGAISWCIKMFSQSSEHSTGMMSTNYSKSKHPNVLKNYRMWRSWPINFCHY